MCACEFVFENTIHALIHRQILSNSLDGEHLMHAHAHIFTHMFTCHNTNPYLIIALLEWQYRQSTRKHKTESKSVQMRHIHMQNIHAHTLKPCTNTCVPHTQSPLPAHKHTNTRTRHTWLLRSRNTEQEKKKTTKTSTSGE